MIRALAFAFALSTCAATARNTRDSAPAPTASSPHHGHHADHNHDDHQHGDHHPQHQDPAHHQPPTADHRFEDPAYWSKVFDDPKRDAWQRPQELVKNLGIAADEIVVDLGAGTGYMVPHLAKAVPKGRLLAIDVEPALLEYIAERVKKAGIPNVTTQKAEANDPKLAEPVDLVLLVDVYHHIGGRSAYFRRVAQRLSPRGRVAIVDFRMGKLPVGPGDDHKLAPEVVTREMKEGGYQLCRSWDGLPYQYVLIFAPRCSAPAS